ncbi:MAG: hypothetical protein GVY19_13980, partial [Bacteroidetes bacterium]|nr:hypothetical protein [Bacteroidota bacterium]
MIRTILVGAILVIVTHYYGFAQLDNEFWFVAPAVTENHSGTSGCPCSDNNRCGASPVSLNFTNTNPDAAIVRITQPANEYDAITNPTGFEPITLTVPANSFETYTLWGQDICDPDNSAMRELIENRHDKYNPTTPMEKGIRITSTEYITAYYEVEERNNSDIFSLKGRNALGNEFFCNFQTNKH